jgi:hypothetical protein
VTVTLGTTANNSLTAMLFTKGGTASDFGAIANAILDDARQAATPPATAMIYPGAYSQLGLLYVPNRGVLRVLPGDFVGVDHSGWPILVSADSIADGATSWAHT